MILYRAYVLVLPAGCTRYRNMHTDECLITIWEEAGCIEQGTFYPTKLQNKNRLLRLNVM